MKQRNNTADAAGPHRLTSSISPPSIPPFLLTSHTVGRVTGRLAILKSLHQMFTFSLGGRRLLLLCCLQIVILIVMKYASGCSEHSKHQMKAVLLIPSTRLFRTAARVSATVSTHFLRTSTRTLFQAFFCSSQMVFPESTLDPSSSTGSRSEL